MEILRCKVCGKPYKAYISNSKYCSIGCKAKSQTYRIDFQKIVEMYERGMTQTEIANELGTTQKVIYNSFRRNGYKCRKAAKRNQLGKNNNSWVGDNATYATFHKRVESLYGRPIHCEVCGTVDPSKRYEWANVTGDYADVEHGYRRMCCSCHRKFDKSKEGVKNNVKRKNKKGIFAREGGRLTHGSLFSGI